MKIIGSQVRERIEATPYRVVVRPASGQVVLYGLGKFELWRANNRHGGYTIQIGRWGYEFVRSIERAGGHAGDAKLYWTCKAVLLIDDANARLARWDRPAQNSLPNALKALERTIGRSCECDLGFEQNNTRCDFCEMRDCIGELRTLR